MIEILFGESEAGSMKFAKSKRKHRGPYDGPTAVFGNPALLEPAKEWESVPGMPYEVISLAYLLDFGDIQESFDSTYRQEYILSMYMQSGWDNSEKFQDSIRDGIRRNIAEYDRLMEFIENGEELRIWYSQAPYSLCGFYQLCSLLRNKPNQVYTVKLPEYREETANTITCYKSWGEVEAEKISTFLPLQKPLSVNERKMFAHKWTDLVEDNSPLRAVVNGELVGVPEDFYDFAIRKRITTEPIREARLLGDILGHYPFSVSDWWYAVRIEHMIQCGEIKIIEDSEQKYTRMISL